MSHPQRPLRPSRRSQVPPFEVMDVLDRVAVLRAAGRDVVSLCAGEPSGGAPTLVSAAASRIHASGRALTYTSALGIHELRAEIAAHYGRWYG
ncbi:MAG: aspartate aminotransferase, partial [Terrabacter sp.]|nr:aspartate aminotransferase [Dermatophilaceae bacterium]NUS41630.1 aspartate aminotransferase [Terrabacter sp.]